MANSIASATVASDAPTPAEIKRFLVPISFLERVWNVVSGIFSEDSLKERWDVKYKIKPDFLKDTHNVRTNNEALLLISKLRLNIEKSDLKAYLGKWTKKEITCFIQHGVALI